MFGTKFEYFTVRRFCGMKRRNRMNKNVFDTQVQQLKYTVLREVARHYFEAGDEDNISAFKWFNEIAATIVKDDKPTMRCCVYKERAIVSERLKLAMGGDKSNPNVIEVIKIACDECPVGGYKVTDMCRGCIAHRCQEACRVGAISFDADQKCVIDKDKCVNCGKCAEVCPYGAIHNYIRPCERACPVGAISHASSAENHAATIDNDKCLSCGSCVYTCPFGACVDKSYIVEVINYIKEASKEGGRKVYALVAPAIYSQFNYATTGQVVSAIKALGFEKVFEVAAGADIVAYHECQELAEKGFLTSSCCPAFVTYVQRNFPTLKDNISSNLSPMGAIAKAIKEKEPDCRLVFIGPCTAKKMEIKKDTVSKYVDSCLTFEELQALVDSRDIEMDKLPDEELDTATYFGRIFARSGGLAEAVKQAKEELGLEDFKYNPIVCGGIAECKKALMKASKGVLKNNFIEGMACTPGCIGGAGCLTHGPANAALIDKYGREASTKTITESVKNNG